MTRSGITSTAAFVGAAALLGVAVAEVSWEVSVLVLVASVTALGLISLRTVAAQQRSVALVDEPAEFEDPRVRPARLAYYLGAASIGLVTIRPALDFTISDWIFLSSLGLVALLVVVQGLTPDYRIPAAITVGVLVFSLGGLVSSTQALYPYASALVVIRMLYLTFVWFWLGTVVLETRAHVRTALVAWVCSAAVSSSGAILQFFYGDVIPGGTVAYGRMTGFTGHVNVLGGLAATAFVPALMLAVDSPRRATRLIGTVSTGLIASGLLLSGSVGGLVAATLATTVWLALRGVGIRILVSGAVVVALAFALMSATGSTNSPSPIDRIKRVTSEQDKVEGTGGTIYTRFEGYSEAWHQVRDQPFVGVGLDEDTSFELLDGHAVHNLLLGPWFMAGILGLVGIVLVVSGAFVTGVRVLRASVRADRSAAAALLASLVAFVEHAMGEPILFVRYGWFPTALLMALRAQHVRVAARSRAWSHAPSPISPPITDVGLVGRPSTSP